MVPPAVGWRILTSGIAGVARASLSAYEHKRTSQNAVTATLRE
jgi:hypothetical protein